MTAFLFVCSFLACGAWLAERSRCRQVEESFAVFRNRYARLASENRSLKRTIYGRLGEFDQWGEAQKRRLESHLQLVDKEPPC